MDNEPMATLPLWYLNVLEQKAEVLDDMIDRSAIIREYYLPDSIERVFGEDIPEWATEFIH